MTSPSLSDLRAFITVGELKSFAAAAKAMHISQPALSRRVSNLEYMLGIRLFDRNTRSVRLTEPGRLFLARIHTVITDLDTAVSHLKDLAQLKAGGVTVGCVFSAVQHFLPSVIHRYQREYPDISVRIVEEGAREIAMTVKEGAVDFALNYVGMHDPELEFLPLRKEHFVVACKVDHPLASSHSVNWSELSRYPYALVSHESGNRVLIDQALADIKHLPRPVCEVRHVSTLIGAVESGLGIAIVPQLALPQSHASVIGVPLVNPVITRTIGLTYRRDRSLTPAANAFSKMLIEVGSEPNSHPQD